MWASFIARARVKSSPWSRRNPRWEEGQTLAFIDVLGVEYDVVAPQAGVISSFHVRDGQPVAYGDRLAEMAPPPAAEDGPALTA